MTTATAAPAPAYRLEQRNAVWLALRRPLLVALLLGCGVSLLASGRFTLRLVLDGTLSFLFVPISELIGFAVVYRGRASRAFAEAVDRFFSNDVAWTLWMVAILAATTVIPARRLGSLLAPLLMTMPIPLVVTLVVDWRFFRNGVGRSARRATGDVALHRLITWTLVLAYFLGVALSSRDALYLFVEIGQEISAWVRQML